MHVRHRRPTGPQLHARVAPGRDPLRRVAHPVESAMPRPETNPTSRRRNDLRWLRRSAQGVAGCGGLKKRISPPARRSSRKRRRGVDQQPNQSQRSRTLTPAAHAREPARRVAAPLRRGRCTSPCDAAPRPRRLAPGRVVLRRVVQHAHAIALNERRPCRPQGSKRPRRNAAAVSGSRPLRTAPRAQETTRVARTIDMRPLQACRTIVERTRRGLGPAILHRARAGRSRAGFGSPFLRAAL